MDSGATLEDPEGIREETRVKTTFLYEQAVFHFHVESELATWGCWMSGGAPQQLKQEDLKQAVEMGVYSNGKTPQRPCGRKELDHKTHWRSPVLLVIFHLVDIVSSPVHQIHDQDDQILFCGFFPPRVEFYWPAGVGRIRF